jgi:hypothetical protein
LSLTDAVTVSAPWLRIARSAAGTSSVQVPSLPIATLSGDDMLNALEAQQPLTVHGSSSAEAGQTVSR